MNLSFIRLERFGCFLKAEFYPKKGINLIVGPNGSGKTTLLSSVLILSGRRPRVKRVKSFISWGERSFQIRGFFKSVSEEIEVFVRLNSSVNVRLNKKRSTLSEVRRKVFVLDFFVGGANLFDVSPTERRRFLNSLCSILFPNYEYDLIKFYEILRQRKSVVALGRSYSGIEKMYHDFSNRLWRSRKSAISLIEKEFYSVVSERKDIFRFSDFKLSLKTVTERGLDVEIARKRVLWGPQFDDILLFIDGRDGRLSLSRGQKKFLSLLLFYAAASVIHKEVGDSPIIFIDDAFSDLDSNLSKEAVYLFLNSDFQVFMASYEDVSCDVDGISRWKLCDGKIRAL